MVEMSPQDVISPLLHLALSVNKNYQLLIRRLSTSSFVVVLVSVQSNPSVIATMVDLPDTHVLAIASHVGERFRLGASNIANCAPGILRVSDWLNESDPRITRLSASAMSVTQWLRLSCRRWAAR